MIRMMTWEVIFAVVIFTLSLTVTICNGTAQNVSDSGCEPGSPEGDELEFSEKAIQHCCQIVSILSGGKRVRIEIPFAPTWPTMHPPLETHFPSIRQPITTPLPPHPTTEDEKRGFWPPNPWTVFRSSVTQPPRGPTAPRPHQKGPSRKPAAGTESVLQPPNVGEPKPQRLEAIPAVRRLSPTTPKKTHAQSREAPLPQERRPLGPGRQIIVVSTGEPTKPTAKPPFRLMTPDMEKPMSGSLIQETAKTDRPSVTKPIPMSPDRVPSITVGKPQTLPDISDKDRQPSDAGKPFTPGVPKRHDGASFEGPGRAPAIRPPSTPHDIYSMERSMSLDSTRPILKPDTSGRERQGTDMIRLRKGQRKPLSQPYPIQHRERPTTSYITKPPFRPPQVPKEERPTTRMRFGSTGRQRETGSSRPEVQDTRSSTMRLQSRPQISQREKQKQSAAETPLRPTELDNAEARLGPTEPSRTDREESRHDSRSEALGRRITNGFRRSWRPSTSGRRPSAVRPVIAATTTPRRPSRPDVSGSGVEPRRPERPLRPDASGRALEPRRPVRPIGSLRPDASDRGVETREPVSPWSPDVPDREVESRRHGIPLRPSGLGRELQPRRPGRPLKPEVSDKGVEPTRPVRPTTGSLRPDISDRGVETREPIGPLRSGVSDREVEPRRPERPLRPSVLGKKVESRRPRRPLRPNVSGRGLEPRKPTRPIGSLRPDVSNREVETRGPGRQLKPNVLGKEVESRRPGRPLRPSVSGREVESRRPERPLRPSVSGREVEPKIPGRPSGPLRPDVSGRGVEPRRPAHVHAVPIDNGVVGDPEIHCGSRSVTVSFNTENPFTGNVYVKGQFNEPACRITGDNTNVAALEIPFQACGVRRERSAVSAGTFCMVVYDCYVDDTVGNRVQLIDEDGCAIDRHLLDNLEYISDLMAGREAHVFKLPDRPNVYFNCQIRIDIKEPGEDCARPVCPPARGKRSTELAPPSHTMDVSIQHPILVGDVDLLEDDVPASLLHPSQRSLHQHFTRWYRPDSICMSPLWFGILISCGSVFIIATLTMSTLLCIRKPQKIYY